MRLTWDVRSHDGSKISQVNSEYSF
jgi:hypothetical protein